MGSLEANLNKLAEAVADGVDVDWERAARAASTPEDSRVISGLRQLASVATLARSQALAWGPLKIRGEVGRGAFGSVCRAWDTHLEREVALKLLRGSGSDQTAASAVIKEGRLLARIRHPNIVTVYGADVFDGRAGIWMEFVTGQTLKHILEEQGPFGAHEAALIGRDLCRALAAVHQQGVLHRDIKAQNVMREAGGRIVLMDFGAGEGVSTLADGRTALVGTPAYLAPEVLAGSNPSVHSDVYSLGVLLYHLVSGRFPVTGQSLPDLRDQHQNKRRLLLRDVRPDLPAVFVRVVDRAIAPDPADRPESAGTMEVLLEQTLNSHDSSNTTANAETGTSRPSDLLKVGHGSRFRGIAAAVAILVMALVILAVTIGRGPSVPMAPVRRNSVAILPFKNLTMGTDSEYFSDGITQDVVAHLAALPDLRVISGASTLQYKDRSRIVKEIGTSLNVATVLDGTVRRSGDRVRIVSQLIDAATGEHLWSDTFDRDLRDVFSMQSEVARKIALALKGELSQLDDQRLAPSHGRDFEAFNLYLKGQHYWTLRTEEGLYRSIQYFESGLDPVWWTSPERWVRCPQWQRHAADGPVGASRMNSSSRRSG